MLPDSYQTFWSIKSAERTSDYISGEQSWIVGLAPELAVKMSSATLFSILQRRLGEGTLATCLDPTLTWPSPVQEEENGNWLKTCHTVGVNVRTIGDFLSVVKYALTLPAHLKSIHLLPIWEPGVVGSLYGMASWELNTEFYSQELYLLGIEKLSDQLKVVINLLHAMGKVVGMDVIPHTDRYSEMVLANPDHFEWLRRHELTILNHEANLHETVQGAIYDWLLSNGPATEAYGIVGELWQLPEADRLRLFFGAAEDYLGRQRRRIDLINWLFYRGLEPVPATMAPPYRGIEVDPSPEAVTRDEAGREWRDYRITQPQEMSRVFGPLARYKLYGRRDDNRNWEIDFTEPHTWVWRYLTQHYAAQQQRFNFDFMRGDMSHVQMRPEGVPPPEDIDDYYDPLRAVKRHIAKRAPHFAYFAESFLTPPGYMAYGDEVAHLLRSEAEVTLGNLQSFAPGTPDFMALVRQYLQVAATTELTPSWTVITADKDDPRFDHFHHHGELERVFTGLFLGALPMYFSLGFEQRDRHFSRAVNEAYTKLYVFQEDRGEKAVSGPYTWGGNLELFVAWTRLQQFAAGTIAHLGIPQLLPSNEPGVLAWLRPASDGEGAYVFVVSFLPEPIERFSLSVSTAFTQLDLLYSTAGMDHQVIGIREDGSVELQAFQGASAWAVLK